MLAYAPDLKWSTQVVRITYQQWDYLGEFEVTIRGNCHGLTIIKAAVSRHADQIFEESGGHPVLILKRPALDGEGEDTLECDADEEDLEEMCVGVRIVSQTALDEEAIDD